MQIWCTTRFITLLAFRILHPFVCGSVLLESFRIYFNNKLVKPTIFTIPKMYINGVFNINGRPLLQNLTNEYSCLQLIFPIISSTKQRVTNRSCIGPCSILETIRIELRIKWVFVVRFTIIKATCNEFFEYYLAAFPARFWSKLTYPRKIYFFVGNNVFHRFHRHFRT